MYAIGDIIQRIPMNDPYDPLLSMANKIYLVVDLVKPVHTNFTYWKLLELESGKYITLQAGQKFWKKLA